MYFVFILNLIVFYFYFQQSLWLTIYYKIFWIHILIYMSPFIFTMQRWHYNYANLINFNYTYIVHMRVFFFFINLLLSSYFSWNECICFYLHVYIWVHANKHLNICVYILIKQLLISIPFFSPPSNSFIFPIASASIFLVGPLYLLE